MSGPLAPRWRTVASSRAVLAVVHNVTAATRLFDVLPVFADDPRVEVTFTCPRSSAFTAGTDEHLASRGIRLMPWDEAVRYPFDLAVSASYGGDLHELRAPLLVVPHGMGYNKFLETGNRKPETGNRKPETGNRKPETGNRKPETGNRKPETGNRKPVFGLSSPWIMHEGELVPAYIVLSHGEQLDRLRLAVPEAAEFAVVAGDPSLDRLIASTPLRETYRQGFGLTSTQRLVLVSSTWGGNSLYGTDPELVRRLAHALPFDSYRIAIALHPNVHEGHSRWQVARWLNACTRAGVLVLPHEDLWRQAILASDVVLGDHGSVTFYAAAAGKPVLLAAAPHDDLDPESPVHQLVTTAPRFDPNADAGGQFDRAVTEHDPGRYLPITELATDLPGKAATALRELCYRALDLAPPAHPAPLHVLPAPDLPIPLPRARLARVETVRHHAKALDLRLTRHAVDTLYDPTWSAEPAQLVVHIDEPEATLLELADVVVHDDPRDAGRWLTETLHALPGCTIAAAGLPDGSWLAGTTTALVEITGVHGDPHALVSAVHEVLTEPHKPFPDEVTVTTETGATVATGRFSLLR
ncbi:hypothetical protein [Amycolatopsis sp. CA-230715]|uniref:hypothetical protein n=1 Tax=Amycolatopsis sp. CA-230715 TaxID=2745196 RepID=UPI001C00AF02|nr:hypothetical protein [Amycolatopsis sp. CA-230715]QWF82706.1 hypothetical protein HUW46_06145 [Amycolatopsis sp. CA-230715]